MTRIIIEVPDSYGSLDLDGQIILSRDLRRVIPIFISDVMPCERVTIRCAPVLDKNGISAHKDI